MDGKPTLMSWCHGGVGIVIRPDMGIVRVHSTVLCESRLIKVCLQRILREAISKTPPLDDGQEEWGVALAECGMGKVIVHGEFSRQGEQ